MYANFPKNFPEYFSEIFHANFIYGIEPPFDPKNPPGGGGIREGGTPIGGVEGGMGPPIVWGA